MNIMRQGEIAWPLSLIGLVANLIIFFVVGVGRSVVFDILDNPWQLIT